jgi:hypothetical protein
MRWETEKTFELKLRLSNWTNRETNFKPKQTGNVHQTALQPTKRGFRSI